MKKLYTILLIICTLSLRATNYYVASTGLDTNTGGISDPFLTIAKINTLILLPGDAIFLNANDTWRESLSINQSGLSGQPITIQKYGTGSNPKILGSNVVTSWINQGGNIWRSGNTFTQPWMSSAGSTADIFFIGTDLITHWGTYNATPNTLYDWYWSANYIYVYSITDPTTAFNSVEVAQRDNSIHLNKQDYITIDGIDCAYIQLVGIDGSQSVPTTAQTGIIIKNCNISWAGYPGAGAGFGISLAASNSTIQNNIIHDTGRRGITIALYDNTVSLSNIIIQNNEFYGGNHTTSLDLQIGNTYTGTINNIVFRYNYVHEDVSVVPIANTMLMFLSDQNASNIGTLTNIHVYYNIFKYTQDAAINGDGIDSGDIYNNDFYGNNQSVGAYSQGLFLDGCTLNIKNNLFYSQLAYDTNMSGLAYSLGTNTLTSDYNIFYRTSPTLHIVRIGGTYYSTADSIAMRTALGGETHSKFVDPKVISSFNLALQSTSPAINNGINVGLTVDYLGNPVITPDIGAYEYQIYTGLYRPYLWKGKYWQNISNSKFYLK